MFKNSRKILLGLLILGSTYFQACKNPDGIKPSTEMSSGGMSSSQGVDIQTPYGVIKHQNTRLQMSSFTYDKIMEKLDNQQLDALLEPINFISMSRHLINTTSTNPLLLEYYENEPLSKIISSQGVIQIDDWIIKVDVVGERVYALHKNHENEISDLINGNLNNPNLIIYNTEDEVLTLLEEGIYSTERGLFCKDNRAKQKQDKKDYGDVGTPKLVCKVTYRGFGIRFVLSSTVNYRSGLIPYRASLRMSYVYRYEGRCKNNKGEISEESNLTCGDPANGYWCVKNNASHYEVKHYAGRNTLKKYELRAKFAVSDEGYYFETPRTHLIFDGY